MTNLERLVNAASAVVQTLPLTVQALSSEPRVNLVLALRDARREIAATTSDRIHTMIVESWDMGWDISAREALIALVAVTEFPDRKISAIRAFRTRTQGDGPMPLLKRAYEIINVAKEVLN